MSPMIMNVAVPWLKHSPRFGQLASSQTEASLSSRIMRLISCTRGPAGARARIHAGFRGISSVGATLTGMRASLSAPR